MPRAANRCGFTLVELIAVLAIIVLLATVVAYSLGGHLARARLNAALDRLEEADHRARDAARRGQAFVELRIDGPRGRVDPIGSPVADLSGRAR